MTKWNLACINLLQELKDHLKDNCDYGSGLKVQYIYMKRKGDGDMFVDDIWLGKAEMSGKCKWSLKCYFSLQCSKFSYLVFLR